jgi:TIR domain
MEVEKDNKESIDVFISHSSSDEAIADALIDLLRAALNLTASQIRCTSIDGYKLPLGDDVNERLRSEIHASKVFIGIITPKSLESAYVLFELGARWGAGLRLLPVLALADKSILKEPLKTLNTGCLYSSTDVHELVGEVAGQLGRDIDKISAYEKHVKTLVSKSRPKAGKKRKTANHEANNKEIQVAENAEADMQMYALLCKAMEEAGGNTYEVKPGSLEHLWAERMVQKGLLERMVSGRFYSLPRGSLGKGRG